MVRPYHTRYFKSVDEVELCLGLTFTPGQTEMVFTYLLLGVRPEAGNCYGCTPAYIRTVTGKIDRYEDAIDRGEAVWPYQSLE